VIISPILALPLDVVGNIISGLDWQTNSRGRM